MDQAETKNIGLRGIVVADTKISDVDGDEGRLVYRGFSIETLAAHSTFEETSYLLIYGELPNAQQLEEFDKELKAARPAPREIIECLNKLPKTAQPMDVLQGAVPLLASFDADLKVESRPANIGKAIRLTAKAPTIVAAWARIRQGLKPLEPEPQLSHAANFLWMLNGKEPHVETAKNLDVCLILHADHSFNASTFAARVVASTHAHMYAAVTAAIGSLSGELHGGANAKVMEMLLEIQKPELVADWIKKRLDRGDKIMGMGHAVYKTWDPRAKILRKMSEALTKRENQYQWFEVISKIEEIARQEFDKRGKTYLYPNVDFYSAVAYHAMNISADLFTPVFAIARVPGWTAHIIEEKFADAQSKPALYRPESQYVGRQCAEDGCTYTPVDERSKPKASTP